VREAQSVGEQRCLEHGMLSNRGTCAAGILQIRQGLASSIIVKGRARWHWRICYWPPLCRFRRDIRVRVLLWALMRWFGPLSSLLRGWHLTLGGLIHSGWGANSMWRARDGLQVATLQGERNDDLLKDKDIASHARHFHYNDGIPPYYRTHRNTLSSACLHTVTSSSYVRPARPCRDNECSIYRYIVGSALFRDR
jgi:hypothetical protein